jgi:cytochrome c
VRTGFDPGPVPAELAEGERLYEQSCARCHGRQAVGTEAGPTLIHIVYEPNHHGDIAFQRAAKFGVRAHHWTFGNMPPVPEVDEAAVEKITTYVRWLQREAGIQ